MHLPADVRHNGAQDVEPSQPRHADPLPDGSARNGYSTLVASVLLALHRGDGNGSRPLADAPRLTRLAEVYAAAWESAEPLEDGAAQLPDSPAFLDAIATVLPAPGDEHQIPAVGLQQRVAVAAQKPQKAPGWTVFVLFVAGLVRPAELEEIQEQAGDQGLDGLRI
eukprot:scaffold3319_cov258-Pinguiococcus_pyrenoidosus.AAC.20